jgi:hypothetical protein
MRRSLLLLLPITLAACGGQISDQSSEPSGKRFSADVAESSAPTGRISVSAAPGVAFQYRYAFRLPATQIEAVQEQHAAACEKLGLSRCRITGMRYRLVNERDVEAMLAFKLDPSIARQFGKSGTEVVTQADGLLVDSEITGEDAGAAIKVASRNITQLQENLARIEEQLARKSLAAIERDRLQAEAQQLRESIRANSDTRTEKAESLATTPMTFTYDSERGPPPLRDSVKNASNAFITGTSILLTILITLLPWLLLGALGWGAFRVIKWRRPPNRQDSAPRPQDAP